MKLFPATAVIPTRHRPGPLERALRSIAAQSTIPAEIVVIDASDDPASRRVVTESATLFPDSVSIVWRQAETIGAAAQRNQACALSTQAAILFLDDDVILEPDCLEQLWRAFAADPKLGGVNAMITNQCYVAPGKFSRAVFAILNGRNEASFAGKVLGPAVNLLPEDREGNPAVVPVEWLNSCCTLYRRDALSTPPFDSHFTGYSMMEDLALSLKVGRSWQLANARTARLFHDSQPGSHKSDISEISCMEFVNRHYIMSKILCRTKISDYARLLFWEGLQVAYAMRQYGMNRDFWRFSSGKLRGLRQILL